MHLTCLIENIPGQTRDAALVLLNLNLMKIVLLQLKIWMVLSYLVKLSGVI